jgi:hypothetical protein
VSRHERWAWLRDAALNERELVGRGVRAVDGFSRADPLWPGQVATLAALLLYLALPRALTLGPGWPLPLVESAVLLALVIAVRGGREAARRRGIAIGLALIATVANLTSLGLLVHYLLAGGRAPGADLLDGAVIVWATNLLLFAVLYWELDRGGPRRPARSPGPVAPDLLFPQMTDDRYAVPG